MAQVLINDTTLSALGDVIRDKKGEDKNAYWGINFEDYEIINFTYSGQVIRAYKVPWNNTGTNYVIEWDYISGNNNKSTSMYGYYNGSTAIGRIFNNSYSDLGLSGHYKYTIPNEYLNDTRFAYDYLIFQIYDTQSNLKVSNDVVIGDNLETTYTPSEMVEEIQDFKLIPDNVLEITGDCKYLFSYGNYNWLIPYIKETKSITHCNNMFYQNNTITEIPFDLNFKTEGLSYNDTANCFYNCSSLTIVPYLNNCMPYNLNGLFGNCNCLSIIPEDWVNNIDWSYVHKNTNNCSMNAIFQSCYSLRNIPQNLIDNIWCYPSSSSNSYAPYNAMYNYCYVLDELTNIPVQIGYGTNQATAYSSNLFISTFYNCSRLKRLTFKMNADGTPIVAKWKSQTIDLSSYVGFAPNTSYITNYNSGLTTATRITDIASYELLKNNTDSWTTDVKYSRYNHDSAVETINSLPDCHATGTNTIKFKGQSGALTDGGAINTLTAEEIAVAAVKGWTVTLS